MKKVLFLLLTVLAFVSCNTSDTDKLYEEPAVLTQADKDEIMDTFLMTQDAWNAGNLVKFMNGYWESEKLVFTGVKGPTYGYNATLERYQKSYPDLDNMGKLQFEVKDLYRIDTRSALMIGKFYLTRTVGDLQGYYTLVWKKIDGKWLIISDHSSGEDVISGTSQ